jgi:outer membrane protein assembly factor BamB
VRYGRGWFAAAVDLTKGEKPERLWDKEVTGGDVPSPVIAEGKVYLLSDKGDLTCLDVATGEVVAEGQLRRHRDRYFSSPLMAGGNLYCLREDGTMFVVAPGEEFEILAENDLGDTSVSSPVPVDGTLLVRTRNKLFRFGIKPE